MNKIYITNQQNRPTDDSTYSLTYEQANKMLPILRSDHFKLIVLDHTLDLEVKNFKFLIQITRLLKPDGLVLLKGAIKEEVKGLLTKLNLFEGESTNQGLSFSKTKPELKVEEKVQKLSIGFNGNQEEQAIDEDELLKGENLDISKKAAEKCQTKPRACANCSCGRKQVEKVVSVEQLVSSINEGQVMTGCGKCSLGDSFRCGTCPYKGFPAFKPGDKLRLVEEGGVVVEQAATFVSATGKIKLEI